MRLINADISFDEIYESASSKVIPKMDIKTVCGVPVEKAEEVFKAYLDQIPTVDAVEVVRCKECKYAIITADNKYCKYCAMHKDSYGFMIPEYRDADFYCAYGERKEEEA